MTAQERDDWVSSEIQRRHEEICHQFFDLGHSETEVVRASNYAIQTVRLILKQEAQRNPERAKARKPLKRDRRKMDERKPISAAHIKLGLMVSRYQSVHHLRLIEMSMLFNLSRPTVSQIITGSYDIPLSQLQFICKFLNVPVEEIFKGMHNGPIFATPPDSYRLATGLPAYSAVQPVPHAGGFATGGPEVALPDRVQSGSTSDAGSVQGDGQ